MTSQAAESLIASIGELIDDVSVAGISIQSEYESTSLTVTPPAGTVNHDKGTSAVFNLPGGGKAVTIDSWGSQANRFESALKRHADKLGFPIIELFHGENKYGTSLDWSHRHADALWRISRDAAKDSGIPVEEISNAHQGDAAALLRYFPASVLFGWWDSHTAKTAQEKSTAAGHHKTDGLDPEVLVNAFGSGKGSDKRRSARIITSEIIAKNVELRHRYAARVDSIFGPVRKTNSELAKLGFGSIPPQAGPVDVAYETIEGRTFISFAMLRRFNFGDGLNRDGRIAIVLLALAGVAGSVEDLHLRVGADLTLADRKASVVRQLAENTAFLGGNVPDVDIVADALTKVSAEFGWTQYSLDVGAKVANAIDKIMDLAVSDDEKPGAGTDGN